MGKRGDGGCNNSAQSLTTEMEGRWKTKQEVLEKFPLDYAARTCYQLAYLCKKDKQYVNEDASTDLIYFQEIISEKEFLVYGERSTLLKLY